MITVYSNDTTRNRYVFEFIFSKEYPYSFVDKNSIPLGFKKEDTIISICYDVDAKTMPNCDIFINANPKYQEQIKDIELLRYNEKAFTKKYFHWENKTLTISFDLVSTILFFLSREEEYYSTKTDYLGRFLTKNLLLHKLKMLDFPIVDALMYLLRESVESIAKQKGQIISKKSILPDGKKYVVCLTHDIDIIANKRMPFLLRYGIWLVEGLLIIARMDWINLSYYYRYYRQIKRRPIIQKPMPALSVKDWGVLEKSFNVRSTFFFMVRPIALLEGGGGYDILSPRLKKILFFLNQEKFEIALHSARRNYLSIKMLQHEKAMLEKITGREIIGVRQHYLRFNTPESFRIYEKTGVLYDTTLGMWDDFGFRAGTTHPFYPFDIENNRRINVLEFSLNIMDGVFDDKGLSQKPEDIFNKCVEFFQIAKKYHGVITLLFHPEHYTKNPNHLIAYTQILKYLQQEKEALILSVNNAYNLYK